MSPDNAGKVKDAETAYKSKNYESKSLMGPLKSLGAPGKYPLFHPPPPSVGLSITRIQKLNRNIYTEKDDVYMYSDKVKNGVKL